MKRCLLVGLGLGFYLIAQHASALSLVDHSAGVKVLAGADLWTTPSNIPGGYSGPGFAGSAGGFSYGAMPYYELRIIKFIGVEAGIEYEHGSFHRNNTINGFDTTETVNINSWRLPLLAKLNIPLALGRIWFGLGPDFTLSQSSSAKFELASGATSPITVATRDVKPTYLTGGLGLVIEMPLAGIEIPIEFRASKDLSQPSDWSDRVTATSQTSYTVRAESSWVLRLGAGIGFQF